MASQGDAGLLEVFGEIVNDGATGSRRDISKEFEASIWQTVGIAADQHNDPGRFTAFVGYEWSSLPDGGDNIHRVVIFADGADKTNQIVPFTLFDSQDPEDLWAYMQAYEEKTGGRIMGIPHNGNLSAGRMFALVDLKGNALIPDYAKRRMRWEPLVETTQIKGDSETHPWLSPDDEFADFESWDIGNIIITKRTSPELAQFEYSRSALKHGLGQLQSMGANPFKFGMIGATDSHTSWSNSEEDNYLGKYAIASPSSDRWGKKFPPDTVPGILDQFTEWQSFMSGYAGVWATENTRDAIFDAMQRKEVYATSGPRMTVRMFGSFDFTEGMAYSKDMPAFGYAHGVPMSGDLTAAPESKSPAFLLPATKDPDGANLDRIQVIKGWVDAQGEMHERIYDVAVSDGREIKNGKATSPVGSTVNLEYATYTNTIGDAQLLAFWQDPDFDPNLPVFRNAPKSKTWLILVRDYC